MYPAPGSLSDLIGCWGASWCLKTSFQI